MHCIEARSADGHMNVELDHIILPVSDIEKSVRFYFKVLRLKYEPDAFGSGKSDWPDVFFVPAEVRLLHS